MTFAAFILPNPDWELTEPAEPETMELRPFCRLARFKLLGLLLTVGFDGTSGDDIQWLTGGTPGVCFGALAAVAALTKGESTFERREGMLEEDVTDEPKLLNSDPSGNRIGSVTTLYSNDFDADDLVVDSGGGTIGTVCGTGGMVWLVVAAGGVPGGDECRL